MTDQSELHFLHLPREIRDAIYRKALTHRAIVPESLTLEDRHYHNHNCDTGLGKLDVTRLPDHKAASSLRYICIQVRNEIDQLYDGTIQPASLYILETKKQYGHYSGTWPLWTRLPLLCTAPLDLRIHIDFEQDNDCWYRDILCAVKNFVADFIRHTPKALRESDTESPEFFLVEKLHKVVFHVSCVNSDNEIAVKNLARSVELFLAVDQKFAFFKNWGATEVIFDGVVCWPIPDPDTRPARKEPW